MTVAKFWPTSEWAGTEITHEAGGERAGEAACYARSLVERSLTPLVSTDPQGKITEVNKATEEATGLTRGQLIGTDFADCFCEPEKARAAFRIVLEEGLLSDYPLVLRHLSGAVSDVEYNATVYRDERGELQTVFAAGRDHEEAQQARLQVARLAAIAASSQNARFTKDLEGKITSWNAAAEMLYGYTAGDVIGRNGSILLPTGHMGETQELIKRMLRGDRDFGFETQRLCKDGTLLDVALTLSPVHDAEGDITGLSIVAHDVSRRVRAERELHESEERLLAAFHVSPDLMDISRLRDGKLLEVNDGFTRLLGHARADVLGATCSELSIWAEPADRLAFVADLEESGQVNKLEATLRRKDGTQVTCVAHARTIEVQGETCVLSIFRDISDRKRAEEALRESEERYRALFDRSLDCVYLHDFEGHFLDANDAALTLLGYTRGEVRSLSLVSLLEEAEAPRVVAILQQLRDTGKQIGTTEIRLRSKDGRLLDVETHSSVVLRHGKPYAVQGIARDITVRKRAEVALRRSEAHLRALIDTLPDLVWLKDPEGVYLSCNRRFESFFGAAEKDIIGKTDYDFTSAEQADSFRQHDEVAMAAASPTANEEKIVFAEDGHREVLETIKTPVLDSDGQLIGVLGVGRDITERRRSEEAARRHAERLRRTVEGAVLAMSRMVESRDPYTAGHERRVAELATAIGAEMGLNGEQLDALRLAGTVHDIGKIAVPAEILSRPGRLSEAEFSLIQAHPATGFGILADVDFGSPVAEMVLQHHERLDGSGYPRGFKGADILPEARILAVADVVEAMSSHRPYRPALGLEAALAEIRAHAGVKFDADVVTVCARLFEEQEFKFTL